MENDKYEKHLTEIKHQVIENMKELSCTDLMEIRVIAKAIVDERLNS